MADFGGLFVPQTPFEVRLAGAAGRAHRPSKQMHRLVATVSPTTKGGHLRRGGAKPRKSKAEKMRISFVKRRLVAGSTLGALNSGNSPAEAANHQPFLSR
jgi:hypothetical protein